MRAFSSGELSRMQSTQEAAMQDECQFLPRSAGQDDYGLADESFSAGDTSICGFDPKSKPEEMDQTQVVMTDGRLRLPLSVESSLSNVYRIKITKRFGVTLSNQPVFEIDGNPERGPSGLVLNLKLVTDGSS